MGVRVWKGLLSALQNRNYAIKSGNTVQLKEKNVNETSKSVTYELLMHR